jgi:hypothetical protein
MRRIKAVASPSQLGLWDELDDPAAFHRKEAMPPSAGAFGGGGPSAPPAPVAMRPDAIGARPASRKAP